LFSLTGIGLLRDLAYEGGIDVLLCLNPDRLAWQYVHQCLLLDEFQRWGMAVQFINQPDLEETPQNRLLSGVQGLFAEYERAAMREHMIVSPFLILVWRNFRTVLFTTFL